MPDPRETYHAAQKHVRRTRYAGMRLVFTAIGFSAAYFLDPERGAARRQQAVEFLRRRSRAVARARMADDAPRTATQDSLPSDPRANGFRPAADDVRTAP